MNTGTLTLRMEAHTRREQLDEGSGYSKNKSFILIEKRDSTSRDAG